MLVRKAGQKICDSKALQNGIVFKMLFLDAAVYKRIVRNQNENAFELACVSVYAYTFMPEVRSSLLGTDFEVGRAFCHLPGGQWITALHLLRHMQRLGESFGDPIAPHS